MTHLPRIRAVGVEVALGGSENVVYRRADRHYHGQGDYKGKNDAGYDAAGTAARRTRLKLRGLHRRTSEGEQMPARLKRKAHRVGHERIGKILCVARRVYGKIAGIADLAQRRYYLFPFYIAADKGDEL